MESYRMMLSPTSKWTRVLVSHGPDELLRAVLPPPSQVQNGRAGAVLVEAISLWLDTKLRVALCVGAGEGGTCLGLVAGGRSLFGDVEVIELGARRRRGARIRGVGDFADLRQLRLMSDEPRW